MSTINVALGIVLLGFAAAGAFVLWGYYSFRGGYKKGFEDGFDSTVKEVLRRIGPLLEQHKVPPLALRRALEHAPLEKRQPN